MPSEINLRIIRARNLPIMDMGRKTSGAYCVVKFGRGHGGQNTNQNILKHQGLRGRNQAPQNAQMLGSKLNQNNVLL